MKKVTPTRAAQIRAARARGMTIAKIATKFGLSVGCISGVVNAPDAAPARAAAEVPAGGDPPTHDDLRRWLGEQCAALRADVAKYRAASNAPALAAAHRNLNAATALLERVTPAPAQREDGMFVSLEQMKDQGEQGREMLDRLAAAAFGDRADWARCRSCGQQIAPSAEELERRVEEAGRAARGL